MVRDGAVWYGRVCGRSTDHVLRLSFHSGGQDKFYDQLNSSLRMRLWKTEAPRRRDDVFSPTTAGVSGIIRQVQKESTERDETLQQAFSDLTTLMTKARELVDMAQRFRSATAKERGETTEDEASGIFLSMGIATPVTRETAKSGGTPFHVSLAREIAGFLKPIMERREGIVSLSDVYCLYNRARGTDLVSPDDLYQACQLMKNMSPPLAYPMRLHRFDSGVLVLLAEAHNEEAATARLVEFANEKWADGGISAADVAKRTSVSVVLAREQLLAAEKRQALCRDQSIHGLCFYPNLFVHGWE